MQDDRIFFKGNPWPEGHKIKEFEWYSSVQDDDIWFDMHLETEKYYSERNIKHDGSIDYPSDWQAPIVWKNFHSCTLSSNNWHDGGFKVCSLKEYSLDYLDGLEINVDTNPDTVQDFDDLAFHIYLLGHDSVANHKFRFERIGKSSKFDITWTGKIALIYMGDYEYRHTFATRLSKIAFPEVESPP